MDIRVNLGELQAAASQAKLTTQRLQDTEGQLDAVLAGLAGDGNLGLPAAALGRFQQRWRENAQLLLDDVGALDTYLADTEAKYGIADADIAALVNGLHL